MNTFRTALLSAALVLAAPLTASATPGSLKDGIMGAWSLASIYEEDDFGEDLDRWGGTPRGHLSIDASGHFMLQLVGANAMRLASVDAHNAVPNCGDGAPACLAYAGTYALDVAHGTIAFTIEGTVSSEVEACTTASVTIDENGALHFVSAAESSPTGAFYSHLVWQRAKAE